MTIDLGITHALNQIADNSDLFFEWDDKIAWISELRIELNKNISEACQKKEISEKHAASLLLFFGFEDI